MNEKVQRWIAGYEKLAAISEKQLLWLKKDVPEDPEAWQEMEAWANERAHIRASIEDLQQQLLGELGEEQLKAVFHEKVASAAEAARVLTFEATRKIELAMISTGSNIQQAKAHRKLNRAYSGYSQDATEAYFFDEKK